MRELANVLRIENLKPIAKKDRIELATIGGWEVIVEKGAYAVGDLVVYIEYDTVLPVKPEFEFLRPRCYSKKYNGFRIRNMSMGGVFSQGIVFPLSILPKDAKEGDCVAKVLGVRKYDPDEFLAESRVNKGKYGKFVSYLLEWRLFRRIILGKKKAKYAYPTTVHKSDETNIQKIFEYLKTNYPNEVYYKTEKIEGQASTYMLIGRRAHYRLYSHNAIRYKGDGSNWDKVSELYNIEQILRTHFKETKEKIAIQGEIAGPGIQKNIYAFPELRFFVYGITDVDTGKSWNYVDIIAFVRKYNLEFVPKLLKENFVTLPAQLKDVLDESNGESMLKKGVKREGIVWRSVTNQQIGFKAKSPKYLIWWNKTDETE